MLNTYILVSREKQIIIRILNGNISQQCNNNSLIGKWRLK